VGVEVASVGGLVDALLTAVFLLGFLLLWLVLSALQVSKVIGFHDCVVVASKNESDG